MVFIICRASSSHQKEKEGCMGPIQLKCRDIGEGGAAKACIHPVLSLLSPQLSRLSHAFVMDKSIDYSSPGKEARLQQGSQ